MTPFSYTITCWEKDIKSLVVNRLINYEKLESQKEKFTFYFFLIKFENCLIKVVETSTNLEKAGEV
jgi:hypothetical protein